MNNLLPEVKMDSYLLRDVGLARNQVRELSAIWRRAQEEKQGLLDKLQIAHHEQKSNSKAEARLKELEQRYHEQVVDLQEQVRNLKAQLRAEIRAKDTWKKKFVMLLQLVKADPDRTDSDGLEMEASRDVEGEESVDAQHEYISALSESRSSSSASITYAAMDTAPISAQPTTQQPAPDHLPYPPKPEPSSNHPIPQPQQYHSSRKAEHDLRYSTAGTATAAAAIPRTHASNNLPQLNPPSDAPSSYLNPRFTSASQDPDSHQNPTDHRQQQQNQQQAFQHIPLTTASVPTTAWRSRSPISPLSQLLSELKSNAQDADADDDAEPEAAVTHHHSANNTDSRPAARPHKPVRRSLLTSLSEARNRDESQQADQAVDPAASEQQRSLLNQRPKADAQQQAAGVHQQQSTNPSQSTLPEPSLLAQRSWQAAPSSKEAAPPSTTTSTKVSILRFSTTRLSASSSSSKDSRSEPDAPPPPSAAPPAPIPSAAPDLPATTKQRSSNAAEDSSFQPLRSSLHMLRTQSRRTSYAGTHIPAAPAAHLPSAKSLPEPVDKQSGISPKVAAPYSSNGTSRSLLGQQGPNSIEQMPSWRQLREQQRQQQEEQEQRQQQAPPAPAQQYVQVQQELDTLLEELAQSSEDSHSSGLVPGMHAAHSTAGMPLSEAMDILSQGGDWDPGYDSEADDALGGEEEGDEAAAELAAEAAYLDVLLQQVGSGASLPAAAAEIARALSQQQRKAQAASQQRGHRYQQQDHQQQYRSYQWQQEQQPRAAHSTPNWAATAASQQQYSYPPAASSQQHATADPSTGGYTHTAAAAASAVEQLSGMQQAELAARVDVLRAQLSDLYKDVVEGQCVEELLMEHQAAELHPQQQMN